MTQTTFDEIDPILESRANIRPPLTINVYNMGYTDLNTLSPQNDDEIIVIQEDDTDTKGSQQGKKKRKPFSNSNELLEFLKQKWENNKEAEAIIRTENLAAREKHLALMERNTEASCFHCRVIQNHCREKELIFWDCKALS